VSGLRGSASAERLAAFIESVAAVGRDRAGGWSRLAFTPPEREAHAVFAAAAQDAGLAVEVDAIGNSVAWAGDSTWLLCKGMAKHGDGKPSQSMAAASRRTPAARIILNSAIFVR